MKILLYLSIYSSTWCYKWHFMNIDALFSSQHYWRKIIPNKKIILKFECSTAIWGHVTFIEEIKVNKNGFVERKIKRLRLARLDLATLGLWDLRSANWAKPASISVSLSLYLTTLIFFHRFPFSSSLFSFSFSSIHLVYSIPWSVRFAFSTKWFATWIVNI